MEQDPIYDALLNIFDDIGDNVWTFHVSEFEAKLAEYGFMIVPIEDPTNLRFGVED